VYDGTPEFLRNLEMDKDALTKAIIGTIGDIDGYQLPDAKGYTAFMRHVLGVTDEERQQRRDEILATSNKDFKCGPGFIPACLALENLLNVSLGVGLALVLSMGCEKSACVLLEVIS
jgi:hypothetical protein